MPKTGEQLGGTFVADVQPQCSCHTISGETGPSLVCSLLISCHLLHRYLEE